MATKRRATPRRATGAYVPPRELFHLRCAPLEMLVDDYGSEEAARRRYEEVRHLVASTHSGRRPSAFWLFEADVPDGLREVPGAPFVPPDAEEGECRTREHREQETARVAWLLDTGRLDDAELAELAVAEHLPSELRARLLEKLVASR